MLSNTPSKCQFQYSCSMHILLAWKSQQKNCVYFRIDWNFISNKSNLRGYEQKHLGMVSF